MSPESTACVFCEIVAEREAASVIYRDNTVCAFLDIRPVTPGHLLVVPNAHASNLAELDADAGAQLFRVAQRLAQALRGSGIRCEGINLFLADGVVAGQEISHVHLHVLPRFRGDGFGLRHPPQYGSLPERAALDATANQIRATLDHTDVA